MAMRFDVESWIWFVFAVGIIVARLISRSLLFGSPKGLQYDDYVMGLFVTACYTVLIVMANIEAKAQSNLLPPGFDMHDLTSQEMQDREYGSKIVVVVEQMQIAVIWACKACLLILYYRLTRLVAGKENVMVKLLAIYTALGFFVMEILYFAAWCRPFSQYWAVPTSSSQCNALINHRITNAVFNISSDLIMLCIALPMFIRSLLPLKRKLILCCIFSLGLFVVLAAILNKYYSFSAPYQPTWIFWYVRESSTAILVANLPFTWTLLRKVFNLGAFDEEHPPPPTYHSSRTAGGRRTARTHNHQDSTGGGVSAEKHASGSGREEKKGSRSMSLIGAICATKDDREQADGETVNENSQHSEHGLLGQAVQPHDFGADNIDLERGTSISTSPPPILVAQRPVSPAATRRERTPRVSVDGTGGFYINNHLVPPRRARLAPGIIAGLGSRSRESSIASVSRSSIDPTAGHDGDATKGAIGGGRSARDRKMRAKKTNE